MDANAHRCNKHCPSSILLIVFSTLANHFNDEDANLIKRYITILWPYCRDTMKALKNAYKGVRSTFRLH